MADPDLEDSQQDSPKETRINKHVLACSLLASLTCVSSGYDVGVVTEVARKAHLDLKFSSVEVIVFFVFVPLFYLLGAVAAAWTADRIGRRYTLLFSCTIFFAGSVLMGFATNFSSFMVGRFCSSVGVGYAVMVAPLYIAEISPVSSSRGFLTSLPELLVNVGSLLGGIVSYCLPMISSQLGWRFMVGIAAFASVFLFIALLSITSESSYWLVMKDRLPDAKRVLEKTSGSFEESRLIFEEIKKAAGIPDQNGTTVCVGLKELLIHPSPAVRHMLITALAVHFFQQASGISVITSFTTNVFEKAGVQRESHQQFISYAIGLAGIMCNLVATALVDKIGRRVLLLSSLAGMAFSLMGFAIGLTIIHHHSHHSDQKITWALTICIICSLFCTVFFSIGIGPIAWIYSSEIFPPRLRALGSGMAAAMNFFTTAIVVFSFAVLIRFKTSFNFGSLFFLYTGIALSGWIFIYLFLPETKGNSLQEMEKLFLGLGPFSGNRIRNSIHHWNII